MKERAGAFSAVTGGRALSFQHLSMGEAAALSLSKGMRRGQNSPGDKCSEKTSPGALGTKEKALALSRESRANTLERYQRIRHRPGFDFFIFFVLFCYNESNWIKY